MNKYLEKIAKTINSLIPAITQPDAGNVTGGKFSERRGFRTSLEHQDMEANEAEEAKR